MSIHRRSARPRLARSRTAAPDSVYVVSTRTGVDQIFAERENAHRYARELPDATVTEHVLRGSIDEAVLVIDRRVVVSDGAVRSDRTSRITHFIDDELFMPEPADVECFRADNGCDWHIMGFGTDAAELDARIRESVDRLVTPSHPATSGTSR